VGPSGAALSSLLPPPSPSLPSSSSSSLLLPPFSLPQVFGSEGCLELKNLPQTQVVFSSSSGITHDNPVHSFPQR